MAHGLVVVKAEGTNEGLADLQARCGHAFPPRAVGARASGEKVGERIMVFRILWERRCIIDGNRVSLVSMLTCVCLQSTRGDMDPHCARQRTTETLEPCPLHEALRRMD